MSHNLYFTPLENNINNVCFNKNIFLISILVIFILILLFSNFKKTNCHNICRHLLQQNNTKFQSEKKNNNTIDEIKITNEIVHPKQDLLKIRDYKSLTDPLSAPTRRLPRHIYPTTPQDYTFDIPTQGYPDNYHYIGNLTRDSDQKIVKLFGRQTYPNSNKYEYYGITSDNNSSEIKISIKTLNNKELYDKDQIDIDFLGTSKGTFKLYMNEYDRPRYNPFIIN